LGGSKYEFTLSNSQDLFTFKARSSQFSQLSGSLVIMSCLQNEALLETIFDEVCEEFPYFTEEMCAAITYKRFEDLCQ
tara:strand:- start:37 stop:270 length:234 start_codon:yes stop_codon:yes gene_type:complete